MDNHGSLFGTVDVPVSVQYRWNIAGVASNKTLDLDPCNHWTSRVFYGMIFRGLPNVEF